jgi:ribonuclease Y
MTQEEAKKRLMENLESQVRYECAQMIKELKDAAKNEAERESKEIIVQAIQRCAPTPLWSLPFLLSIFQMTK